MPKEVLKLVRWQFRPDGIFGHLRRAKGDEIAVTLEHAYFDPKADQFSPKLYDGSYKCVRGDHKLFGGVGKFETFEITGVLGHTGILFHTGNYNHDSNGCVLLGESISELQNGQKVLSRSRMTFNKFMIMLDGVHEFVLEVSSVVDEP